jgi:8-hydroxy-5-deazaflavin:NADPH oxidoreductase
VLFYSGDDAAAKAEIAALIERLGFAGLDLGSLEVGNSLAGHSRTRTSSGLAE